jgi:hypothetical protein
MIYKLYEQRNFCFCDSLRGKKKVLWYFDVWLKLKVQGVITRKVPVVYEKTNYVWKVYWVCYLRYTKLSIHIKKAILKIQKYTICIK